MPRIRQNMDQYAHDDFVNEVKSKRGRYDLNSNKALALATGMTESTTRVRVLNPDDLTVGELRRWIRTMHLDIWTVLRFIGFDTKEVNRVKKEEEETQ